MSFIGVIYRNMGGDTHRSRNEIKTAVSPMPTPAWVNVGIWSTLHSLQIALQVRE